MSVVFTESFSYVDRVQYSSSISSVNCFIFQRTQERKYSRLNAEQLFVPKRDTLGGLTRYQRHMYHGINENVLSIEKYYCVRKQNGSVSYKSQTESCVLCIQLVLKPRTIPTGHKPQNTTIHIAHTYNCSLELQSTWNLYLITCLQPLNHLGEFIYCAVIKGQILLSMDS